MPTTPALPNPGDSEDHGGWLAHWLTDWFWDFFAGLATSALGGVLDLLGTSLLATPQLDQLPVMGQIWGGSRRIVIACSVVVVILAGLVVMAYQSLQTRSSVKEILPRLAVGFLAANLSLFFGGKAIEFANALSYALLGGDQAGVEQTARAFTDSLRGNVPAEDAGYTDLYAIFTVLALVVMIIAVLLTYIVRVALTVILLAGAPLLLMCHALPHTEAIAFWWWKAFGGMLAVQVCQSLAFIAAIKLFYLPGGITLF
ncbi:hypothetical protein [Saccharopolyspora phatthalungensis]|uniref:TrbL/VirB6 plasmid conjugal transfer protein n=1 Tax=Saccharopolyspora phatthalungensis TaxID=664693 RepID=A0A840Q5K7_9PSEU|nr:hypothetical protein [Saccharopolyspora phatthalungensis]MBB5155894.1 hypothetical protein [Saccharopolyspora phatthalungensis]